jgi:hypothetical protein
MQAGFRSRSVAGQGNKASVAANATSEVEPVEFEIPVLLDRYSNTTPSGLYEPGVGCGHGGKDL